MGNIAIKGMGLICAAANNKEDFAHALYHGKSGLDHTVFNMGDKQASLGRVKIVDEGCSRYDRSLRLASMAVEQALESVKCRKMGLICASSLGGITSAEDFLAQNSRGIEASPLKLMHYPIPYMAKFLSKKYKLMGPAVSFSSACISSFVAIGYGLELLYSGVISKVLICAVDTLCHQTVYGFKAIGASSNESVRPFDRERKGMNLGEAAAAVLLERADHLAPGTVEIAGYGLSNDGFHLTAPHPEGEGLKYAIERALEDSSIMPKAVDLIHAHGAGTKYNDAMELHVLEQIFSESSRPVPVFSTKGQTGHTLGPSGLLALIGGCLALQHEFIPGTKNFVSSEINLKHLELVATSRQQYNLQNILITSSGFTGHNGALIARKVV